MLFITSRYSSALLIGCSNLLTASTFCSANLFDLKKKSSSHRIIGGSDAPANRYPYTVALTNGGDDFFCGGSLIAPDIVVTAAHCLDGSGGYNVAVGRTDLSSNNEGEEIRVEKEIRHPNYSTSTDEYDIALLLLSRPVQVLTREDMVRINDDESFPSPGVMSRTMGWGDTDPDDGKTEVSLDLQEVDLPIISNSECGDAEGTVDGWSDSYRDYIYESMICTFRPGQDACQGDSGKS